ncbi:MAG: DUF2007 domain-containing protein [Chloroflexota bacterium]
MGRLSKSDQPDWMVVYITHNHNEAYVISGRLEHEGIPNMVHVQPGASAMGITIGMMGEIKVLVAPPHYDAAMDILFPEDEDDPLPPLESSTDYIQEVDDDE